MNSCGHSAVAAVANRGPPQRVNLATHPIFPRSDESDNFGAPYRPAMTPRRAAPLLNQNLRDLVLRQYARRSFVHVVMK
jgi:hypothetical protein